GNPHRCGETRAAACVLQNLLRAHAGARGHAGIKKLSRRKEKRSSKQPRPAERPPDAQAQTDADTVGIGASELVGPSRAAAGFHSDADPRAQPEIESVTLIALA